MISIGRKRGLNLIFGAWIVALFVYLVASTGVVPAHAHTPGPITAKKKPKKKPHRHPQALHGSLKTTKIKVIHVQYHGGKGGAGEPQDDYPASLKNRPEGTVLDQWGMYNRNCTSWVAWALFSRNGFKIPFYDDAKNWSARASRSGFKTDSTPAVGSVAWSNAGYYGHVAYVTDVQGGSVTIQEYNHVPGAWSKRTVPASHFAGYIHFKDRPGGKISGPDGPKPGVDPVSTRLAAVTGCGALVMQQFGVTGWVQQLACGDAKKIALSGDRLAAITGCGSLVMQQFGVTGWVQQLACGDAKEIAISGNRLAAITGCGALVMQQFGVTGWVQQLACGDAKEIAISGNRLAAITGCGALVMQQFGVTGWVQQLACGDAKKIALSGDRLAAITGCGSLVMQQFGVTGWVQQLACGDAKEIAISGNRLAAITGCGALVMQQFGVTGWVQQLACGDAKKVTLSGDHLAAVNGCDGVWMQHFGVTGWVQQLACGDAREVALPNS